MKKQTLVILAIVVGLSTLLTVSALSNDVEYKLSPCDAIDLSLENATVTDFLKARNMTTVQVYNFKGYKGENTWMVQWSSSNMLLDVYVNVATGHVVGIVERKVPTPTPALTQAPTPTPALAQAPTPTPTPSQGGGHPHSTEPTHDEDSGGPGPRQ